MAKIDKIKVDNIEYDIGADYSNIDNKPNLSTVATSGSYNDLSDKPTIPDVSNFITKDVNNLTYYTLATETGSTIELSINSSTYVMTMNLKNSAGTTISTQNVDLPLESMVVNGRYDSVNKKIVLTLQSGSTIDIPVGDLVSGLQTEITSSNKLSSDLVDDTISTNKFVTSAEKSAWNNKSDFSGDYNDLTNKPTIPSALADLSEDTTHRVVTDTEKTTWNAKQDIMQYSTIPIASSENVGKIIQYTGTTDSAYTNGYFYICTENSGSYSWENLEVQASSGGGGSTEPAIIIEASSNSNVNTEENKSKFLNIINKYFETGTFPQVFLKSSSFNTKKMMMNNFEVNISQSTTSFSMFFRDISSNGSYSTTDNYAGYVEFDGFSILVPFAYDSTTNRATQIYYCSYNRNKEVTMKYATNSPINELPLFRTNNREFTPTGDYNPSTKLYTDKTHYENMAGYDATKTQVLKNINGTLTWVDES